MMRKRMRRWFDGNAMETDGDTAHSILARRSQSAALALHRVYHVVQNNKPISALFNATYDSEPLNDDETTFLQGNELSRYILLLFGLYLCD